METKAEVGIQAGTEVPQYLIDQINSIVPGSPVREIRKPGFTARTMGNIASGVARFLIWLDASIYSMLCWWGGEKVVVLQSLFHAVTIAAAIYYRAQLGLTWWGAALVMPAVAVLVSIPIQFMLYAFEFSLMGKNEKKIGSFTNNLDREIRGSGRIYESGKYEIGVYHSRPTMPHAAFLWPLYSFFLVTECLAHYLLVVRDHALGNKYGSFVLLPEDWVEFYKEVPKNDYTGFVPEHFTRRLDQVLKDHQGEVFVLVPFGIMPGHLPGVEAVAEAEVRWNIHLAELQRPQGDPVLAVRLNDQTRYGRMLVVGHWLTIATLQKANLLFQNFDLDPVKTGRS